MIAGAMRLMFMSVFVIDHTHMSLNSFLSEY